MKGVARLVTRGFLLQAMYNAAGQQRGGLAWILGPDSASRNKDPFNTNPTLAGYIVGLSLAADRASMERRRRDLASALGALGDRLVWGLLRPLAVVAALLGSAFGAIPAAVTLLLVYNPPELCLRWRSNRRGLEGFGAVAGDLSREGLPRIGPYLGRLAAVAVGCLLGFNLAEPVRRGRILEAAAASTGFLVMVFLLRRKGGVAGFPAAIGSILLALVWLVVESVTGR